MAQTHTPGPWKISGEFADDSMVLIFDADGNVVCEIEPFTEEWTVGEVFKTHLIAAAPELLEALKLMLNAYQRGAFSAMGHRNFAGICVKASEAAKTAIAKAEKLPLARTEGRSAEPTSEGSAKAYNRCNRVACQVAGMHIGNCEFAEGSAKE